MVKPLTAALIGLGVGTAALAGGLAAERIGKKRTARKQIGGKVYRSHRVGSSSIVPSFGDIHSALEMVPMRPYRENFNDSMTLPDPDDIMAQAGRMMPTSSQLW